MGMRSMPKTNTARVGMTRTVMPTAHRTLTVTLTARRAAFIFMTRPPRWRLL